MRYKTYEANIRLNPGFQYQRVEVADCTVFDILRAKFGIALIRCPQFFGMFPKEQQMVFSKGKQFPKTYVPNVLNVCADVDKVVINDIELVEEGEVSCEA